MAIGAQQIAEVVRKGRAQNGMVAAMVAAGDASVIDALASAATAGMVADAIDLVRAGTTEIEPIDLTDAQDLIAESRAPDDGAVTAIDEHLQCVEDCETIDDAIANLREAADAARTLAATCAELVARLEAGRAG